MCNLKCEANRLWHHHIACGTRKPCYLKETVQCSVLLPTASDFPIVIYIHCIKADVNVKL